jgi:hypothetical protein
MKGDETMADVEALDLLPVLADGHPLGLPQMEALILQSLLSAEGISAEVSGYWAEPVLPFRLLVSSAVVEQASRLVAEARAGCATAADEAELAGEAAGDVAPEGADRGMPGLF